MDYAAMIRSNIEHYRALLTLFVTDETRLALERLLAKAQAQLEQTDLSDMARSSPTGDQG